jgi:hypothetical protein
MCLAQEEITETIEGQAGHHDQFPTHLIDYRPGGKGRYQAGRGINRDLGRSGAKGKAEFLTGVYHQEWPDHGRTSRADQQPNAHQPKPGWIFSQSLAKMDAHMPVFPSHPFIKGGKETWSPTDGEGQS